MLNGIWAFRQAQNIVRVMEGVTLPVRPWIENNANASHMIDYAVRTELPTFFILLACARARFSFFVLCVGKEKVVDGWYWTVRAKAGR